MKSFSFLFFGEGGSYGKIRDLFSPTWIWNFLFLFTHMQDKSYSFLTAVLGTYHTHAILQVGRRFTSEQHYLDLQCLMNRGI